MHRRLLTIAAIVGIVTYFSCLPLSSSPALWASESAGELQVGNVVVSRIVEREGPMMTVPAMYPGHAVEELADVREWLAPFVGQDARLVFAIQTFVVRTNQSLILVETGVGLGKERAHENSTAEPNYLHTLRQLGYTPEDVNFVVNTHLHRDHIGWNTRRRNGRWVPTFPHATYVFPRADWEYWKDKNDPMVEENIRPLMTTDQVLLIDADRTLDREARIEIMPGHTPGHFVVHLESQGQHAVIAGDILHHPLQTAFPDWVPGFDIEPNEAREARHQFLRTYADTETLLIPAHFPGHPGGYIATDRTTWRWKRRSP